MVWQLAGTTSGTSTTVGVNWKEVFQTYLSTRTGWTAVDHPSNASHTALTYTAKNLITNTDYTWYYHKNSNSPYFAETGTYTTTPGDSTSNNYPYASLYNSSLSSGTVFRIWYSTENDRDMLVTYGQRVLLWMGSQAEYWVWPGPENYAWDGSATRDSFCPLPASNGSGFLVRHAPVQTTTNSSTYYGVPLATHQGYSGIQSQTPMMFSAFTMITTGDSSNPYYPNNYSLPYTTFNQADVKYHCSSTGASIAYGTGFPHQTSENQLLVLYQGNYYLRTEGDTNQNSFMLDFGPTEPNFSATP